MDSVWSEELEDKLVDLWQEHECLYQVTAFYLTSLYYFFTKHTTKQKYTLHSIVYKHAASCVTCCGVVSYLSPIGCRIVNWVSHDSQRARTHRRHNSTQLNRINSQHVQFPNFRRQSSWASCEFNTHRRRDSTRQLSLTPGHVKRSFITASFSHCLFVCCLISELTCLAA